MDTKKIILNLLFLFLLSNCFISHNKTYNKIDNDSTIANNKKKYILTDTILLENNVYVLHSKINNKIGIINYGIKGKFLKSFKDTVYNKNVNLNNFILLDNNLIYKSDCGTACSYAVVFPLDKKNEAIKILYPLLIDRKNNIIIYKGNNPNVLISILYLKNYKIKNIVENYDKSIIPPINVIDTLFISNNRLNIKWFDNTRKVITKQVEL